RGDTSGSKECIIEYCQCHTKGEVLEGTYINLKKDYRNWLLTTPFLMPFNGTQPCGIQCQSHAHLKKTKNCMILNLGLLNTGIAKIFTQFRSSK
uniref:Uncharacterized protein n=1 Tax=Serinus canaria TaxID=9135 RepID=A0A8C9NV45_SERCA